KAVLAFSRELMSRVRELPGVSSVGAGSNVPLTNGSWGKQITAEGEPEPAILINETAARKLFNGKDAIGRRVWLGPPERLLPDLTRPFPRYTVAGIVR